MPFTPEELTALQIWSGRDHANLSASQLCHVLTALLREPSPHVWGTAALVRYPAFTHEVFLRIAAALGPHLHLPAFAQIGQAYLLAQQEAGATLREIWRLGYGLAVIAKQRQRTPSRAPRADRNACTELVETFYKVGVGEVGCACWGEGEIAALLQARSRDLRDLLASLGVEATDSSVPPLD